MKLKMPKQARIHFVLNADEAVLAANKQGLQYLAKWVSWMSRQKLDTFKEQPGIHFHLRSDNEKDAENGNVKFQINQPGKINRKSFDFVIYGTELAGIDEKQRILGFWKSGKYKKENISAFCKLYGFAPKTVRGLLYRAK